MFLRAVPRHAWWILVAVAFAGLLLWASGAAARTVPKEDSSGGFATDRILVKEEKGASRAVSEANRRFRASLREEIPGSDVSVVELPEGLSVEEAIERYEAVPGIEYAERDFVMTESAVFPRDPRFKAQYGLHNRGQTGGRADADVDAPEAWSVTAGSSAVVIAVVDSGTYTRHADLKGNIWRNPGEVAGNRVDDDRNGYVDDVNGWDFAHKDNTLYHGYDEDDHGTHVAGVASARGNNGVGIAGVSWRSRIMPLKYIGPGGAGYTSDAVAAINYAVKKGAAVINISSGCDNCFNQSMLDAIKRADVAGRLVVTTSGNAGRNNNVTRHYPCNYASPNVICVAATDHRDVLAGFSNYGSSTVDLAAPGVNILGTVPNGGYASYTGTSQAAPHVAGVAALIKSKYPGLTDAGIKSRILRSVDRKQSLSGKTVSGGRLNASRALR
jgi:thermitase